MRITLIHNPSAGDGDTSAKKLVKLIGKQGDVTFRSRKDKNWAEVLAEPADLIVAAGGDGTVRQVALRAPRGSLLAILPLGTANNIAHSLGIAGTPKEIIAGWKTGRAQKLDFGRAVGPWGDARFLEGIGFGAVTQTAARMDAGEAEGKDSQSDIVRARKTLNDVLANGVSHWFDVSVDGQSICEKAVLLEIANMRYIGPRLAFAPMAQPDDGVLDIIWVPEDGRDALRDWLKKASASSTDAPVKTCQGAKVQIRHGRGQVRLDDEFWPAEPDPASDEEVPDIDVSLVRGALSVLLPGE